VWSNESIPWPSGQSDFQTGGRPLQV
jgi:hypothetical protein